jgi:hypothetical protein
MANNFEIRIVKDSEKKDAKLHAMSLEVAKSFLVLIEAVTRIVENTPNNEHLTINVKEGSVKLLVEGEGVEQLQENFINVVKGSTDKTLVDSWRRMQTLFKQNGLTYEATISTLNKKTSVYDILKSNKPLRAKPKKKQIPKTNIEFIDGILLDVGGKNPNIHVEIEGNKKFKINCTEENAIKAREYLYQKIYLSCWSYKKLGKKEYDFCDSYIIKDDSPFFKFKKFIYEFENAEDELDSLDMVYDECLNLLKLKKYNSLKRFLKLFLYHGTDVNTLHTITILTQYFKENEDLKEYADRFEMLLDNKVKNLNKTS